MTREEEKKSTEMGIGSDMSTEVSSGLSSALNTSPAKALSPNETLEESDKQILEWAGRLEMESVDLREKSAKLVEVLSKNSEEVGSLVKQLRTGLAQSAQAATQSAQAANINSVVDSAALHDKLVQLGQRSREEAKGQDIRAQVSYKVLQDLLLSLSRQLEDQHQVITSMSKDISDLHRRQISFESRLSQLPKLEESLQGTTLEVSRTPTRKRTSQICKAPALTKRIKKRRDLACRTIIPWDEVDADMYYSSEL